MSLGQEQFLIIYINGCPVGKAAKFNKQKIPEIDLNLDFIAV